MTSYSVIPSDEDAAKNRVAQVANEVVRFVKNPVEDIQESAVEALSLKTFWEDMKRREHTEAHQGVVVLGFLQLILLVLYVTYLQLGHVNGSTTYVDYVSVEVIICTICQTYFSVRSICVENSPMLLVANLNMIGVTIRLGLSVEYRLLEEGPSYAVLGVYAFLTLLHLVASWVAWGGEFSRFAMFAVGPNSDIQRMFRQYQSLLSASSLDLQWAAMAIATLLFFTKGVWWHYVIFTVLFLFSIAHRTAVRQAIRKESVTSFVILVPLLVVLPIAVALAMWYGDFIDIDIIRECKAIGYFTASFFFLSRIAMVVAALLCLRNFDKGMLGVFEKQKSALDFLKQRQYRPLFLARTDPIVADRGAA